MTEEKRVGVRGYLDEGVDGMMLKRKEREGGAMDTSREYLPTTTSG